VKEHRTFSYGWLRGKEKGTLSKEAKFPCLTITGAPRNGYSRRRLTRLAQEPATLPRWTRVKGLAYLRANASEHGLLMFNYKYDLHRLRCAGAVIYNEREIELSWTRTQAKWSGTSKMVCHNAQILPPEVQKTVFKLVSDTETQQTTPCPTRIGKSHRKMDVIIKKRVAHLHKRNRH
jgi:hypothetical protein